MLDNIYIKTAANVHSKYHVWSLPCKYYKHSHRCKRLSPVKALLN